MTTYIPNATQTAEPIESRTVESAALEFRTLKASVAGRIANLQAQNNSQDVRIQAIEAALLVIGEGGLPGTVYVQRLSGNGAQTTFTLNVSVPSSALIDVFINGVYQNKDTFTISGTSLTFSEAPPAGTDNIEVVVSITIANVETDASLVDFRASDSTTVVRTAQDKMREFVSVKDFGAVGDGVTDDTAAIQAALNYANLLPYQVLEVVIPRGIYKITSTITQQANVVITGPGTVQPTAPFSGTVVWDYNNTAGYQDTAADSRGGIDRLRIKASGTIAATALRLTMGWSNLIRNVLITGVAGNGVHIGSGLWNLENVKVQHAFNYGINNAIGFYLDWCADTSLTNVEAVGYNVGVYASPNAGNNHIIRAHCWGYWYDNTSLQPTGPLCRFPFVVEGDNNVFIRCVSDTPETSGASVPWSQSVGGIGYSLLGNSSTLIGCIVASSPVYLATPKLCGIYVNGEQNNIVACHAFYGMRNGKDGLVFSAEGKKITNYVSGGNINLHNTSAIANVPFAYNNGVEITTSQTAQVTAQKLSSNAVLLQISMTLASDPNGLPAFQAYLTGQYIPYSTTKVKFAVPEWSAFAKNAASKSAASVVGEIHLGTCRFYTVSNLGAVTNAVTLADFKNGTFSANVFIPITY